MTWLGDWIWIDNESTSRNAYVHFRRKLNLAQVPSKAVPRLTADSRYIFWVNGKLVCRGPSRCDPRWQSYDELDIAPLLREGENTLAVLVHHYGEGTFSYIPGRTGFLFECGALNVWSDTDWKVMESTAWFRDLSRMRIQLGFPEVFDARRELVGWNAPEFDDSRWAAAVIVGKPPCAPWVSLEKREIPFLRELEVSENKLIVSGETEPLHPVEVIDLQKFFQTDQLMTSWQVAYACTYIASEDAQIIELELITAQALKLWANDELILPRLVDGREIVALRLKRGWNRLMLKLAQGHQHWKTIIRFVGSADRMPRAWRVPELLEPGTNSPSEKIESGWAISGPYKTLEPLDVQSVLDSEFAPELENAGGEFKAWQRLTETRGQGSQFGGGSERAVALLMEFSKHRPGLKLEDQFPVLLGDQQYVLVDFGREVIGYPRLRLDAPAGTILDIGYGEQLFNGILRPNYQEVAYADRLITRAGAQCWEAFEKRAFRYLQIDCRQANDPVRLERVSVNFSTYPVEARGNFSCSDSLLNQIWQTGAYTVQLNMEDAYIDSPWRERSMWWGDAKIEFLVNAVAFGDAALMRRGLRLIAQSQDDEGTTCGVYPTAHANRRMPSSTLIWIHSLWDYYWMTGDAELVRELYPKVQNALKWFARYVSTNKLLSAVPGWIFIDGAPMDQRGEQAALNAMYSRALEIIGSLSEIVNARNLAIRYRAQAREVKAAFHRQFWQEERNAYVDCRAEGERSTVISQQTNALAVLFDIAPSQLQRGVLDAVCGIDATTDPVGIVPCHSPYFAFYLLGAMHRAGMHSFALEYVRARWKRMLDGGATTWWERWTPDGSWCHGWSASPTYYLTSQILGVRPTIAGWREFEVRPQPCGLEWAQGTIPTPQGEIAVEWHIENGRCKTTARAPLGTKYRIIEPATIS